MVLLLVSLLGCTGEDGKDTGDTGDTGDTADTSDTDTADTSDTDTADTSDTAETTDTPAARGAADYSADCARCHGEDGKAGIDGAPDLTRAVPRASDGELTDVVRNGKGDMPAFPAYDDAKMGDLLVHLRATFP